MRLLLALLVVVPPLDDEYFIGKKKVDLADIVDSGGKIYIRIKTLNDHDLKILWRPSADGARIGVVRDGVGGSLEVGNGKPALEHSGDMFLTLDAIENTLNVKVLREVSKFTIDPKQKANKDPPAARLAGLGPGDRMVDLTFAKLKGDAFTFSKNKKRVLLVLWASWDASRARLKDWQKFHERKKGDEFIVVAAALDAAGPNKPDGYCDRITMPVLLDAHHRLAALFDVKALSHWVFIDEQGFVIASQAGLPDETAVEKLIARGGEYKNAGRAWVPEPKDALSESRALYAKEKYDDAFQAAKGGSREAVLHRAAALLRQFKEKEAIAEFKEYLKAKDGDTLLRRQKWAVELPAKMYADKIDEGWLKSQEETEKRGG